MSNPVSQSHFFMWRTLFSLAHADNIVTDEEVAFMANVLEEIDFTDEQMLILKDDIINAKDVGEMFKSITNSNDRMQFFNFARELVWADGDFGSEEQSVMIDLMQEHLKETNVDDLVGKITLELEDDSSIHKTAVNNNESNGRDNFIDIITSFRKRFS